MLRLSKKQREVMALHRVVDSGLSILQVREGVFLVSGVYEWQPKSGRWHRQDGKRHGFNVSSLIRSALRWVRGHDVR